MIKLYLLDLLAKIRRSYKSWTIWLNSIILLAWQFSESLQASLPIVKDYIPPQAYSILGLLAAINILLRFKTVKSLAEK